MQFYQMQERGLKPNAYIYNALIKAQAYTGDIGEVKAAARLHLAALPGPICSMLPHSNQMGHTLNNISDDQPDLASSIHALHHRCTGRNDKMPVISARSCAGAAAVGCHDRGRCEAGWIHVANTAVAV